MWSEDEIYPIMQCFLEACFFFGGEGGGGGGGASTPKFGYSPPPQKSAHILLSSWCLPLQEVLPKFIEPQETLISYSFLFLLKYIIK